MTAVCSYCVQLSSVLFYKGQGQRMATFKRKLAITDTRENDRLCQLPPWNWEMRPEASERSWANCSALAWDVKTAVGIFPSAPAPTAFGFGVDVWQWNISCRVVLAARQAERWLWGFTALKKANACVINEAIYFRQGQLSFYPRPWRTKALEP